MLIAQDRENGCGACIYGEKSRACQTDKSAIVQYTTYSEECVLISKKKGNKHEERMF